MAVVISLIAILIGAACSASLLAVAKENPDTPAAETITRLIPEVDPLTLSGQAYATAKPADCLQWELGARNEMTAFDRVTCEEPHRFEVAGRLDLAQFAAFGDDTKFPDASTKADIGVKYCTPMVARYANGKPVDPQGRFVVTVVPPSQNGWDAGDHSVLCGISTTEIDGSPSSTTGSFVDADQHWRWPSGTCLGFSDAGRPGGPVSCAGPHSIEIISDLDVSELFEDSAEVPDAATQVELTSDACYQAGVDHMGGDPEALRQTTLIAAQVSPLTQVAWTTGSRIVNCGLMKAGKGDGFAVLTGDAGPNLLIDGTTPQPPTTTALPDDAPITESGG